MDSRTRLAAIIALIKEHGPEIICLQEVWSNAYLRSLKRQLPDYYCVSSGTSFYNQSGLVFFSKEKPLSSEIYYFKRSLKQNFTEWFLRKGYITVKIDLGGQEWTVINTHLYAAFSSGAEIITEQQFEEMVHARGSNTILCGDLNLEKEALERLNQGVFSQLCNAEFTLAADNPYSTKLFNRLGMRKNRSKKIDYVLYKGQRRITSECQVITQPFVSDHFPILCKTTSL